jgi:hypothetical protein
VIVLFLNDDKMLIKVSENLYYYGNGKDTNDFGKSPLQWLRFNPYMEDVSEADVEVPKSIMDYINKHRG